MHGTLTFTPGKIPRRRFVPQADATPLLAFHQLANIVPLMTVEEFAALVEDIKGAQGLLEPITLYEGKILDGRNRARACRDAGVEPRFTDYEGDDPLAFVISMNIKRRHLKASQRAMAAAELANMPPHRPSGKSANLQTSQPEAAKRFDIGTRYVASAAKVREFGAPELIDAVKRGRIVLREAERLARRYDHKAQREFLAQRKKRFLVWSTNRQRKDKARALAKTTRELPVGERKIQSC